MPAGILDGYPCPSCFRTHDLCAPDVTVLDGPTDYVYVCPATDQVVRITPLEWSRMDVACPVEMVPLGRAM